MLIGEYIQTDLNSEDFEKIIRLRYHMSDKCTQTESPANIINTQEIAEGDGVGLCRPCFVSLDPIKSIEKWQFSCTQRSRSVSTNSQHLVVNCEGNSEGTDKEGIGSCVEESEIRTRGESLNYNDFESHFRGNKYSSTKATEHREFCREENPLTYIQAEENLCGYKEGSTIQRHNSLQETETDRKDVKIWFQMQVHAKEELDEDSICDELSQKDEISCKEENSDESSVEISNKENKILLEEKTDKIFPNKR